MKKLWLVVLLALPVFAVPIPMSGNGYVAANDGPLFGTRISASGTSADGVSAFVYVDRLGRFPAAQGGSSISDFGFSSGSDASIQLSTGETFSSPYFTYVFDGELTLRSDDWSPLISVALRGYINLDPPRRGREFFQTFTISPTPEPATFLVSGLAIAALLVRRPLSLNVARISALLTGLKENVVSCMLGSTTRRGR